MPTTKKIFTVQNLQEKLNQSKGLVLTDFSGLAVSQLSQLREEVKKSGGELEVVKNNLLRLALEAIFPKSTSEIKIEGPTAVVWLYQEDFSPLKILDRFISQNERPKIKFGFWEGEKISEERIKELAKLPAISELRGKLLAVLQSPTFRFTANLEGTLKKLLFILKAIQNKIASQKGGEN